MKNTFLRAIGIAAITVAFAVSGNAQSATSTGTSKTTVSSSGTQLAQSGSAVNQMTIADAQIQGWAMHSTESTSGYQARLNTNLGMLRAINGVASADYDAVKREIRLIFSGQMPSLESIVQNASRKVTKCAFDLQSK